MNGDERDPRHRPEQDYEVQPEAPVLGDAVQDDPSETLVGLTTSDPLDAGYVPPDHPYGVDDPEVTGEPESLDERLRREQPENTYVDIERAGRLVNPGSGAAEETPDALEAIDVGVDGGAASAEEAAVHEYDILAEDDESESDEQ